MTKVFDRYSDGLPPAADGAGHGTHVAGIAAAVDDEDGIRNVNANAVIIPPATPPMTSALIVLIVVLRFETKEYLRWYQSNS